MASIFSHAIVAIAIGKAVQPKRVSWRFWLALAILSSIPDLDVIGFAFGVRYGDILGHRGFSHSLLFAALLAAVVASLPRRHDHRQRASRWHLFACCFLAIASHGVLDAMTDGGLGVAFFSPFDTTRYFFPFRPIAVSPIGVAPFFSGAGLAVIRNEFAWLWLPSLAVLVVIGIARRFTNASREEKPGAG